MADVDHEIPVYYANTVQLRSSFFDLQVRFHCETEQRPQAEISPPLCVVVMTPEHARALVQALTATLIEYEANCGPIRTPQQAPDVKRWEER